MNTEERFWTKVEKTEGCWTWTGASSKGYGQFRPRHSSIYRAHRWLWERLNGPVPAGLCVLHRCDNPACVRPDHLVLGTQAENLLDMTQKGRRSVTPSAGPWAKLSWAEVRAIRAALASGAAPRRLAESYGVSDDALYAIRAGQSWREA